MSEVPQPPGDAPDGAAQPAAPRDPRRPSSPVGIVAPEWCLERSPRGAALWRHAGAIRASAREEVEVLALDPAARGTRFTYRDQWNVPASGARFRVRRVAAGPRRGRLDGIERARLEGLVLDWVRERRPRLAHVLDLEPFGPGLLLALDAAGVPSILTMERPDELRALRSIGAEPDGESRAALACARRIVVRSPEDAAVAQWAGAPRERIRVMTQGPEGEIAVLRAYASLYRMLAA